MDSPTRFRIVAPAIGAGLLAFGLTACGNDPTASNVAQSPKVDTLLAEVTSTGQSLATAGASFGAAVPVPGIPRTSSCSYDAGLMGFVCPASTIAGITTKLFYQLLDASNAPQSAYKAGTIAAIRTVTDMTGTLAGSSSIPPITMNGHNDQTLSGLLTGSHVLNGNGTMAQTITLGGGTPTTLNLSETTTNLVLPSVGGRWPQSGSMSIHLGSGTTDDVQMTMTFNGTSVVSVVIVVGGKTQNCTMDLLVVGSQSCLAA